MTSAQKQGQGSQQALSPKSSTTYRHLTMHYWWAIPLLLHLTGAPTSGAVVLGVILGLLAWRRGPGKVPQEERTGWERHAARTGALLVLGTIKFLHWAWDDDGSRAHRRRIRREATRAANIDHQNDVIREANYRRALRQR